MIRINLVPEYRDTARGKETVTAMLWAWLGFATIAACFVVGVVMTN